MDNLANRTDYLTDMKHEIEITEARIKELGFENKDLKRRQKILSKDLMSGSSFLEKLLFEEEMLHMAKKKYDKYDNIYKETSRKVREFTEKTEEYQQILETRVHQYHEQGDYIAEEENLERFEELQAQKEQLSKYESVYKRNYLMKLKELENLVSSISKHDQIIQETTGNIQNMRNEIDTISSMVRVNRKRNSVSMLQEPRDSSKSGRRSTVLDMSMENRAPEQSPLQNDKNQPPTAR